MPASRRCLRNARRCAVICWTPSRAPGPSWKPTLRPATPAGPWPGHRWWRCIRKVCCRSRRRWNWGARRSTRCSTSSSSTRLATSTPRPVGAPSSTAPAPRGRARFCRTPPSTRFSPTDECPSPPARSSPGVWPPPSKAVGVSADGGPSPAVRVIHPGCRPAFA